MSHPMLVKAAQHTAQARAINDEFSDKPMPAEAARQLDEHLKKAAEYRDRVNREAQLVESEQWIAEPQYKHDMAGGTGIEIASKFGHGKVITDEQTAEYQRKAFFGYVRQGERGLSVEQKAALVEDATGQNLIPRDFAGSILLQLPRLSVIRPLVYTRPTTKRFVDVGNITLGTAGWGVLETAVGTVDSTGAGLGATPAAKQTIQVWEMNALVKLGIDELNDSDENLEAIIRDAVTLKFAEVEDDAFAAGVGDASFQPFGLSHGVTQSVTAGSSNTVTGDDLKNLQYQVPLQFRRNGSYIAHTKVHQGVALLKDSVGRYLLQPSASQGEPDTLFGYPFYTADGLADPSTAGVTDISCLFGDLRSAYMICDRQNITVKRLEELYAGAGQVGLLFTHRVGGDTVRPAALAKYLL